MKKRVGFIGLLIHDRRKNAPQVNALLGEYGDLILGRMGIPCDKRRCWVITVILEATTDEIGALTGKLGRIEGVTVKSALTPEQYE